MSRNLDSTMASHLGDGVIQPVVLAQLTLKSGVVYVWSGIGDLVFEGHTFKGVGYLGRVGTISEASEVKAEGTTVTLSGIGLTDIDLPPLGITPPAPPFTPPAGQSVAWSLAGTHAPVSSHSSIGPSVFNGFEGVTMEATSTTTSGNIAIIGGDSLADTSVGVGWLNFKTPQEIPVGATITGVYPVIDGFSQTGVFTELKLNGSGWGGSPINVHTLSGLSVGIDGFSSLPGGGCTAGLGFIGVAVYYEGTPVTKASLIYEAMNDVRIGGPAKIWYGLWSNGAFIGTPYLAFSGTVDKPTVNTSASAGTSITLALENRLINLQRPSQRRFTAADQHLAYPDDLAFNWVELLNDMSLKEGTA